MALSKQAKTLSKSQIKAVTSYLSSKRHPVRNTAMFLLSVKAGLRAKEIAELKWSYCIDASGELADCIHLPNTASKGKSSGRVIPMAADLKAVLASLLLLSNARDYVIESQKGGKMSAQVVTNWFFNLYAELGLDGCSSHSGRRTAITRWARNATTVGGSLRDVQALAGHSSLNVTQRYIEFETDAQKRLVDL